MRALMGYNLNGLNEGAGVAVVNLVGCLIEMVAGCVET
jgi:hypothetical protein